MAADWFLSLTCSLGAIYVHLTVLCVRGVGTGVAAGEGWAVSGEISSSPVVFFDTLNSMVLDVWRKGHEY